MDVQKLCDAMSTMGRVTRSDYHLTLGGLIKQLESLSPTLMVKFDWNGGYPYQEMSYRGYYSDLAFDWRESPVVAVAGLLNISRRALGRAYTGYKGGDFVMNEQTPLWAAPYGDTGRAIMGLEVTENVVVLKTKDME